MREEEEKVIGDEWKRGTDKLIFIRNKWMEKKRKRPY